MIDGLTDKTAIAGFQGDRSGPLPFVFVLLCLAQVMSFWRWNEVWMTNAMFLRETKPYKMPLLVQGYALVNLHMIQELLVLGIAHTHLSLFTTSYANFWVQIGQIWNFYQM